MAFFSKSASLLRQGVSRNIAPNGSVPMMHLLNSARHMSSSKLFVGGLAWAVDDMALREAFANFGNVIEARVITDRESGRSRGFGFVNFDSKESASSALNGMDGQDLNGRNIRVSYANERPSTFEPRGNGGGY